jgi:8-oxo-dGTP diphosphatase
VAHPCIDVVAAILRDAAGRVLVAQRPPGRSMAGWWEFPGGKVEPGETGQAALERELAEELGIEVLECRPYEQLEHTYADRSVRLAVWMVARFRGEPAGLEGQALRWIAPGDLPAAGLLPADLPIAARLAAEAQ